MISGTLWINCWSILTPIRPQSAKISYLRKMSVIRGALISKSSNSVSNVREAAEAYFRGSIQGNRRGHLPSTFDPALNLEAMLPETIERNQKIVRLERIDGIMTSAPALDFARLESALRPRRDPVVLSAFTDLFQTFPGERPAFVAFKSELADDLKQPDWLDRMIERSGPSALLSLGCRHDLSLCAHGIYG